MARILLREILQSYSAGELAHFIGVQTISEFEKLKEREISTQELAEAVFNYTATNSRKSSFERKIN